MEPNAETPIESKTNYFVYDNRKIRSIIVKDDLWLCAVDVCEILGHKNNRQATSNERIGKQNKKKFEELLQKSDVHSNDISKYEKSLTYINEFALGMLASSSRVPCAVKFQKWIFGEVLPSIRKYGYYRVSDMENKIQKTSEETQDDKDAIIARLKAQLDEQKAINVGLQAFHDHLVKKENKEYIYIATNEPYAKKNVFKVGGSSSKDRLINRLPTYNTGRYEEENFYFAYIIKVYDHRQIESRIKDVLGQFRVKKEKLKEMYIMNFHALVRFLDYICENYEEEIKTLHDYIDRITREMGDKKPFVPEPIILEQISYEKKPALPEPSHKDIQDEDPKAEISPEEEDVAPPKDRLEIKRYRENKKVSQKVVDLTSLSKEDQETIIHQTIEEIKKESAEESLKEIPRKLLEEEIVKKGYKIKSKLFWSFLKTHVIDALDIKITYHQKKK